MLRTSCAAGLIAATLVLAARGAPESAQSWAQFRFDAAHTGSNPTERRLRVANVGRLRQAWVFHASAPISSSPVVADGSVYVGADNGRLYALDEKTGHVQWTAVLAADGAFVSSPAYSSGVVYAVTSEEGDGLHAVSAAAGTELWKAPTTLAGLFPGAPTVAQGSFYAVYDDLLVLDPATGHVRWIRESVGCFVCSPAVANGTLYIGGGPAVGRRLLALDAVTGVERWSFKPQVVGDFDWNGSPAVADDTVYIAGWATRTQAQRRKAYSLSAFDAGSGERRWKVPVGSSRYITGSSPAVAHGIVYYASPSTGLYALRTRDGKRLWKAAIGLTDGSPAVANGVVYVGARHGVSAFGAASGKRLWSASGPADFNPPVVVNGSLYAASSDGRLHAYRLRPRR